VPGVLGVNNNRRGADVAMIVLGGVAGCIMATHFVMLFWDKTELELAKEKRLKAEAV